MENDTKQTELQEELDAQTKEQNKGQTPPTGENPGETKPEFDQNLVDEAIQKRLGRQEVKHQKELETVKAQVTEQVTEEVTKQYESKLEAELAELRELKESLAQKDKEATVKNFVSSLKNAGLDDSAIAVLTTTVDIDKMADFDPSILTKTSAVALKTKEENAKLNEKDDEFDPYAIY